MVRLQVVGSEKQKEESCIVKGGNELPLQLSKLREGVALSHVLTHPRRAQSESTYQFRLS
jgi:hypothetical protein